MKNDKKAQSTLEYAVVIVCVVAALLAIQVYIKRGIQGRLRSSADSIGEQYAPGNTTSNTTLNFNSNSETNVSVTESYWSGSLDATYIYTGTFFNEADSRTGNETVGKLQGSLF